MILVGSSPVKEGKGMMLLMWVFTVVISMQRMCVISVLLRLLVPGMVPGNQ